MKPVIIICVIITMFSDLSKSYKIKEENNTRNDISYKQFNKSDSIEAINSGNSTSENQNSSEKSDLRKQLNDGRHIIAKKQETSDSKESDKIQNNKKGSGRRANIKRHKHRIRYGGDSRLMVRMSSIAVDDCSTGKNRADDGTCVSIEITVDSDEIEDIIINTNTTEITEIVVNTKELT